VSEAKGLAFVIDGREYLAPDLDSLNMGERRVMYDLCGIVQEDFAPQDGETADEHDVRIAKLTRHPGFMEALMHIAYQRGNPTDTRVKVQKVIESTNYLESIEAWAEAEDGEAPSPLALTTEPAPASSTGSAGSSESSGEGSRTRTGEPVATLQRTGTTPWGT
jgi:hypothetical protein